MYNIQNCTLIVEAMMLKKMIHRIPEIVMRVLVPVIGVCFGILNIVIFSDLPEYCEEYILHGGKHTSYSSDVLVLNIIFLIQAAIFLWFGIMHLAWMLFE